MTVIVLRAVIFYVILTFLMRLMGKRQIGELQLSEFVTAMLLSEMAVLPITDRDIPLLHGLVPVLLIASFEVIVSFVCRKSPKFRTLINGNPIVLVKHGRYIEPNLTKARVSSEDIDAQIRINGYESIADVKTVILERTGKMSVLPKNQSSVPTSNQSGTQ